MFHSKTRILIVDDFSSIREMMASALKELDFTEILQAEDGEVAWRAINNIQPPIQLVISDWNMPKMTGIDLLRKVRGSPKYRDLPFLLVTTENEKERVLEAVKLGVSNYVVKPFTTETIKKKLEDVHIKLSAGKV